MKSSVLARFSCSKDVFICPVCKEPLFVKENSLVCENGHCFDISSKGYVNLAPSAKKSDNYGRETFLSRRKILEAGFYDHILSAAANRVPYGVTVDAGCGEGYYSKRIAAEKMLAFDISKESVALAARGAAEEVFFVGDLANIPLKNGIADCILNVFSPANYSEFGRVLKKDGILVKAVPSKEHLCELRELVKDELASAEYSNEKLLGHCRKYCDIVDITSVKRTFSLTGELRCALVSMTPLMFGVNAEKDVSMLKEITVSATVITAKVR